MNKSDRTKEWINVSPGKELIYLKGTKDWNKFRNKAVIMKADVSVNESSDDGTQPRKDDNSPNWYNHPTQKPWQGLKMKVRTTPIQYVFIKKHFYVFSQSKAFWSKGVLYYKKEVFWKKTFDIDASAEHFPNLQSFSYSDTELGFVIKVIRLEAFL